MEYISGVVERITYQNEDNGFQAEVAKCLQETVEGKTYSRMINMMIRDYTWDRVKRLNTILFHITQLVHIMYYHLAKEEMQMAFGGVDLDDCRPRNRFGEGIAIVVVIILLLIAMGIVF